MKAPPGKGKVWRLLTTKRLDRVWVARGNGELVLAQLGASAARRAEDRVPAMLVRHRLK